MENNPTPEIQGQRTTFDLRSLPIRIAATIQAALFPTRCLVCGTFFKPDAHGGARATRNNLQNTLRGLKDQTGGCGPGRRADGCLFETCFKILFDPFLCPVCRDGFEPVESPFCVKCGVVFVSRQDDDHFCGDCLTRVKKFSRARAAGVYNRALMAVIHCYKYRGKIQLARPLGALLLATFMRYWDRDSIDIVIPVPLHISRLRKRGFNQALLLVRDWNRMTRNLNAGPGDVPIECDVMMRNRRTDSQTGLARKLRMTNIKNAFSVKDPLKIEDRRVLLVDDVYTTGATVEACAAELMDSGAQTVDVVTLARAM